MLPAELITTYLQMTSPAAFAPRWRPEGASLVIMCMDTPLVSFYRYLYREVGGRWAWRDRDHWHDARLKDWLAQATVDVYVLYVQGVPAGYIELDRQPGATEIAYFGLLPEFFGQGYGSHLLSFGVARAWEHGAPRVWVHTCNLDSPHAMRTYQRIGFAVYDEHREPMPARYKTPPLNDETN
ncbi:MAG: GNAT family N-acetyltransferase [Anaerolineales bacterium]